MRLQFALAKALSFFKLKLLGHRIIAVIFASGIVPNANI